MALLCSFGLLLGRLLISMIFILAGFGKFMDYSATAEYMASKGMSLVPVFLVAAALIEIIGGLAVLFGVKTRWGAALLLFFLIPTTLIFHDFWNFEDANRQVQMIEFLKNLAIMGGLLYVLCHGAGRISIDTLYFRERASKP
jgi:putative oxidoreductase